MQSGITVETNVRLQFVHIHVYFFRSGTICLNLCDLLTLVLVVIQLNMSYGECKMVN